MGIDVTYVNLFVDHSQMIVLTQLAELLGVRNTYGVLMADTLWFGKVVSYRRAAQGRCAK